MRLDDFDGEELLVLAKMDLQRGAVGDALSKLKQASQLKSTERPAEVLLELARLYAQVGLKKKAQEEFRRYLLEAPEDIDALFQFGMVQYEQGKSTEAFAVWDDVLSRSPAYPPAHYFQSEVLVQRGDVEEAVSRLRKLVSSIPADNLYHQKARDLMAQIASRPQVSDATMIAATKSYGTAH
jgi:tetratricopeptide (TPR) repeat protein